MTISSFSRYGSGFYNDTPMERAMKRLGPVRLRQEQIKMEQAPRIAFGSPITGRFGWPMTQVGGGVPPEGLNLTSPSGVQGYVSPSWMQNYQTPSFLRY